MKDSTDALVAHIAHFSDKVKNVVSGASYSIFDDFLSIFYWLFMVKMSLGVIPAAKITRVC